MSTGRGWLSLLGAVALAASLVLAAAPDKAVAEPGAGASVTSWDGATDRTASGATCRDYMFPVSLGAGQPERYSIFGRLCHKGELAGKTLQVLLHGGTYDHTYWDFPYQPENYNYVRSATNAGYATLSLDRIGYGYSSHINPLRASFDKQGWTVHQVVQQVRAGKLGADFFKIVLVGHSMGSFSAWDAAAMYRDVDAVIVTAAQHNATPFLWTRVVPNILMPAQLDPKFASKGYPPGTLTTFPGVRCSFLYHQPNVDPKVCEVDEQLKSTVNAAEGSSFPPAILLNEALTDAIDVPVLMVDGQFDHFYCERDCNDREAKEREFYSGTPCYQSFILPASGHTVNLQRNAKEWFNHAHDWLDKRVGVSRDRPATAPCR